jgi:PE-PPE domain/PE family
MSYVMAQPEAMAAVANDAAAIGSTISTVNAAAAEKTTALAAAAGDEVSAAVVQLFSGYGRTYQALSAAAATFHQQFVQALSAAATTYAGTEVANASAMAADANSPLGNGIAFVMGGSGLPTPFQRYAQTADALYLQLRGFTGTAQILTTPELSNNFDVSMAQGSQILTNAIMGQIQGGLVSAQNPVVVFGYSQSSVLSTFTMQQLHALGVPTGDVHFVLVGDTSNPNGGVLTSFVSPGMTLTIKNYVTLGIPTPNNLYPTDVYTLEYDGWADFPHYPLNLLADLNAVIGMDTRHLAYLGLAPSQIANAIQLPTSSNDTLTNYYMIRSEGLPILDPLRLAPIANHPLYDLLEPDTRILVNLGYGSITDGWNQGPADVQTSVGLFPTNLDWSAVLPALGNGAQQGITACFNDLINPDTYRYTPVVDSPALTNLIAAAYGGGDINNPHPSSLWEVLTTWKSTPPESS